MTLVQRKQYQEYARQQKIIGFVFGAVALLIAEGFLYSLTSYDNRGSMAIYLTSLDVCMLFAAFEQLVQSNRVRKVLLWIAIVSLALPMALRAQTGIDDITYKNLFLRAMNSEFFAYIQTGGRNFSDGSVEAGYLALNYVLYHFTTGDYNIAQFCITMLTFAFFGLAMAKEGGDRGLPLQLLLLWSNYYFLIMQAGLVRIFLSAAVVYYALWYLFNQQSTGFVIWILVASMFHMSAMFMLLLLPLSRTQRLEVRWVRYVVMLMALCPLLFVFVARFVVPLLPSRYKGYGTVSALSISIGQLDTLPLFALCALRLHWNPESIKAPRYYYVCLVLMALSPIISASSSLVGLGRLIFYANLSIVYLCPRACLKVDGSILDYVMSAILVAYAFVYVGYTCFFNEAASAYLFPYTSFIT